MSSKPKSIPLVSQERLLRKIARAANGCWTWLGTISTTGYGSLEIGHLGAFKAHRVSYRVFVGEIPEGLFVLHHCDNPRCVNPEHLYAGTAADNARDMLERGRHVAHGRSITHCPRGHEYTPENTYRWKNRRDCRECQRIDQRARKLKEAA